MKKKFIALFAAIILIASSMIIPANAWVQYTSPSQISGSDFTDNPAFAKALDQLFAGDIDLYTNSSLKKEVSLPLGSRVSMTSAYYMHSTSKNTTTHGWTCYIYGNGAFNRLFGEYVRDGKSLKNCYIAVGKGASKMTYELLKNANIRAGAYIRTSPKSDGSYYGEDGHSMIILAYTPTHITYLEGNGDGKGLVRVTKRTYSEFNYAQLTGKGRKVTHIVQPTDEWFKTLYGSGPEDNVYSFSYNSNGGNGSQGSFTAKYGEEITLSSPNMNRDGFMLSGWSLKRDDGKWLTKNGWKTDDEISENSLNKTVFQNGEVLEIDSDLSDGTNGNESFTAYAVWEISPVEVCESVALISSSYERETYPVGSIVDFKESVIEFTFESGNTTRVTVDEKCSSEVSQSFKFNGNTYEFYIDASVSKEGKNDCFIRIADFNGKLTTVNGSKEIASMLLLSDPTDVSGTGAQLLISYDNSTTETVNTVNFTPEASDNGVISGIMRTDSGILINWSFSVTYDGNSTTATYCGGKTTALTLGDIDLDGKITTSDLAAMKIVLMTSSNNFYDLYCTADFNGDGEITSSDLSYLKLHLSGI